MQTAAIVIGLALLVAVLFGRTTGFGFCNYDDPEYVTENEHVQSGLTADSIRWALTSTEHANWFPLTWLSLELDYELWGVDSVGRLAAGGFHLTNVVLHATNTLLLFWFLRAATANELASGCVAALFANHPLHVESVAWITERKDVLSTLFWMLTLLAYTRYARRPSIRRYLLVVTTFGLGLAAKQMLVTLPCVLLLIDYWPLRRWQPVTGESPQAQDTGGDSPGFPPFAGIRLVLEKLPLLVLSAALSTLTFWVQVHGGAVRSAEDLPVVFRLMTIPPAYVAYLAKAIWPAQLAVFYPHPAQAQLPWLTSITAALLVLATAAVFYRRRPWLLTGWLWYLGTLVPVIGLVQVGRQGIADRYTYIPLIGIFIAVVWQIRAFVLSQRLSPRMAGVLGVVALASFAACTWVQVGYWRDNVALWQHALEVTGPNGQVLDGLGEALMREGREGDALPFLSELVKQMPDYDAGHINLAVALLLLGETAEGKLQLQEGLRINPRNTAAQFNLGRLEYSEGNMAEAEVHVREALRIQPRFPAAQALLSEIVARSRGDEGHAARGAKAE